MDSKRIISASVWSPLDKNLFKVSANETAECTIYYCENENCKLFLASRQCINNGIYSNHCPYGNRYKVRGPGKRAKKCYEWVESRRKEYKEYLNKVIGSPPNKMAEVGEYLYLPYSYMTMNENVPFLEHASIMYTGKPFIKLEEFTDEVIRNILEFRAIAFFGGEITAYRNESIPVFLLHLKELYPAKYEKIIVDYPQYEVKSNIGRRAMLNTVMSGEVVLSKYRWFWNGENLVPIDKCVSIYGVVDCNRRDAIEEMQVVVTPTENAVVVITREDQVSDKTVFVD